MPILEILIGPICSGKSTICKQKAKEGYIIINDDSLFISLHGGDYKLYNKELKNFYKKIETDILTTCLSLNLNVVIDRPNHKSSTRKRYIELAKTFEYKVIGLIFPREEPKIHARRRYVHDDRGHSFDYWIEVAERHNSLYEKPSKEEGFDELINITPKFEN